MYTIASKVLGVDRARRSPAFSAILSRVLSDWRCLSEDQPGFLMSRSRRRQPSSQRRREPACANRPPCERLFLESGADRGYLAATAAYATSEERRVGKECRSRWSPYH